MCGGVRARLIDIIHNGSDTDSLRAIEQISNRVYGKPTERMEIDQISETDKELDAMTEEEREALLRRLERETGGSLLRLVHGEDEET